MIIGQFFLSRYPDVDCEQVWLNIAPKYQKRRRPGDLNIFEIIVFMIFFFLIQIITFIGLQKSTKIE